MRAAQTSQQGKSGAGQGRAGQGQGQGRAGQGRAGQRTVTPHDRRQHLVHSRAVGGPLLLALLQQPVHIRGALHNMFREPLDEDTTIAGLSDPQAVPTRLLPA